MKKLLLSLSLFLIIAAHTNHLSAQNNLGFGIRGGINFANLNDTDTNVGSRTGLMAGVYFSLPLQNSPVIIQPEVLYTQKGFKENNVTFALDYIQIPLIANFPFKTKKIFNPFVYFGPYIAFKIHTEIDPLPQPQTSLSNQKGLFDNLAGTVLDESTRDTDLGIVAGAGINVNQFNLSVRYTAGFADAFGNGTSNGKNSVISIVAGVGF